MLSKEQFIAQFPYRINPDSIVFGKPLKEAMRYNETFQGVEVYRCLNLLIIKKGDELFTHS